MTTSFHLLLSLTSRIIILLIVLNKDQITNVKKINKESCTMVFFIAGTYIMVVGELLSVNGQHITVNSMKIQDLSHDDLAPTTWSLEVKDYRRHATPS